MVTANMGVETFETTIKLDSTYCIDAPLKGMVIEELVTGVKYLWHKKMKGIDQKPIMPERQVYPTKTELLPSLLIFIELPGINVRAKVLDELDSFVAMTWRVAECVTKLIGNGMREW
jgi:hypothetical protein